jgi:hypothetical protein
MEPPRPPPDDARPIRMSVRRPIDRASIPGLCAGLRFALETNPAGLVICETAGIDDPDIPTVEALARLHLTAKRLGCRFVLRDPAAELADLLELAGLSRLVGVDEGSGFEPRREAEEREQPLGVEEERDP